MKDPVYLSMDLAKLQIDPDYQRDLNSPKAQQLLKKLVDQYNPHLLGVLSVAEHNGVYSVWDGQLRLSALRERGEHEAMCLVSPDCSPQEQASLFLMQVDRRNLTSAQYHKAALAAQNPDATLIEKTINQYNVTTGTLRNETTIRAIGALYWIYKRGGQPLLDDTIQVTVGAGWAATHDGFSDRVLKGLSFFLGAFPASVASRDECILAFSEINPAVPLGEATSKANTPSSNVHALFAGVLLRQYNRSTGKRLRSVNIERLAKKRVRKLVTTEEDLLGDELL